MKLLLVEDDQDVARLVARSLREAGHEVAVAHDGSTGLARGGEEAWDAILLDVVLPGMSGLDVCKALRQRQRLMPILMLTARDAVSDRVRGLDVGADDYLIKPFAMDELQARLRAVVRRVAVPTHDPDDLRVGDLHLDINAHEAQRAHRMLQLTNTEFALLRYLMTNAGRVLTRDQIRMQVWSRDAEVTSNVVDIYIHYLRDKVDRGFATPLIQTVRGVGYMIKG